MTEIQAVRHALSPVPPQRCRGVREPAAHAVSIAGAWGQDRTGAWNRAGVLGAGKGSWLWVGTGVHMSFWQRCRGGGWRTDGSQWPPESRSREGTASLASGSPHSCLHVGQDPGQSRLQVPPRRTCQGTPARPRGFTSPWAGVCTRHRHGRPAGWPSARGRSSLHGSLERQPSGCLAGAGSLPRLSALRRHHRLLGGRGQTLWSWSSQASISSGHCAE